MKVMDEDEDEDDEVNEDIAKNLHLSLDEELLGGGGSAGNKDKNNPILTNHNTSIASFVNDMIRDNSPNPDTVASILSPSK